MRSTCCGRCRSLLFGNCYDLYCPCHPGTLLRAGEAVLPWAAVRDAVSDHLAGSSENPASP